MTRLQNHGGAAVESLKEDLKFARQEVNELSELNSKLEYQVFSLKNEKEVYIKNALKSELLIKNMQAKQIALTKDLQMHAAEHKSYKDNYEQSQ